jgi:hypothetical protein
MKRTISTWSCESMLNWDNMTFGLDAIRKGEYPVTVELGAEFLPFTAEVEGKAAKMQGVYLLRFTGKEGKFALGDFVLHARDKITDDIKTLDQLIDVYHRGYEVHCKEYDAMKAELEAADTTAWYMHVKRHKGGQDYLISRDKYEEDYAFIGEGSKEQLEKIMRGGIMLEKLLKKGMEEVVKEMDRVGFIDDSDRCDRFLDGLARKLVENELVPCGDNEKEAEVDDLSDKLLEKIKENINFNSYSVNAKGDCLFCYYRSQEGLAEWLALMREGGML